MPYRHAPWFLLPLFPLILLAFWPGYFSVLGGAPLAFHIHGIAGLLWILLLMVQSWAIHGRRNELHKTIGRWSFLLFVLFTVGGMMVVQTMARATISGTDPFYEIYGARLGLIDSISTIAIPWFFVMALKLRRKVHLHARYMFATLIFLFMPIFTRLIPDFVTVLAINGPEDFHLFTYSLHIGNAVALVTALFLYARAPNHGQPYLVVGGLTILQSIGFEWLARTQAWQSLFKAIAPVPTPLVVAVGIAASAAVLWLGWNGGSARRTPAIAG